MSSSVSAPAPTRTLRVLSYNIQLGMASARYRDYVTKSWRHLVPYGGRFAALDRIAERLSDYDLVALQETDGGSFRTGFVNATEYLASRAGFRCWLDQVNRRIGPIARHGNGLLCRATLTPTNDIKLPGLPGRGALVAQLGLGPHPLTVVVVHLALGQRVRTRQIDFLAERLAGYRQLLLMGDLNCEAHSPEIQALCERTGLKVPYGDDNTFPSWGPRRRIDHVLASANLRIEHTYVPAWKHSDHLPLEARLSLPALTAQQWETLLAGEHHR